MWCGIVATFAAVCAYMFFELQYRFGGYDLSPLIDSGWRVLSGQVPNRDFICTFPPLLYLTVVAAFKVFGVCWFAITVVSVIVPFAIAVAGLRLFLVTRKRLGDSAVLVLSLAYTVALILPLLTVGHLWHSSWTEMFALYAFAATFALLQLTGAPRAVYTEPLVHLCVAETGLFLGKPNTAFVALLFCTLVLLLKGANWHKGLLALAASLIVSSLLLALAHTSLLQTAHVYSQLSSRFYPQGFFDGIFVKPNVIAGIENLSIYLPVLPLLLWVLVVVVGRLVRKRAGAVDLLAAGACIVSVVSLGTNVEFRIVDTVCIVFGAAMLGSTGAGSARRFAGAYIFALYTLCCFAVFYAATRARMQAVGEWGSEDCGVTPIRRTDRFFGDFHNCAPFFSLLAETDQAVAAHPGARVFFGPRMEFLYARERLASPKGLPLWWHPGSSFPLAAVPAILQAWQDDRPDLLIFLKDDRTRMPPALLDAINRDYVASSTPVIPVPPGTPVPVQGQIDVLVRR